MARKAQIPVSELRLEVLPSAQRKLWDELGGTPPQFVLYGGTAIALRLGHRQSVDFDFFALESIDTAGLLGAVPYLAKAVVQQEEPQTLVCRVKRGKQVSVSFFGLPSLRQVAPPDEVQSPHIKLASLLDLAGMKMAVVSRRARAKDYLDVHALMNDARIELIDALAAAAVIYGAQFNPLVTLKALTYFGEPEVEALPRAVKRDIGIAAKSVNLGLLTIRIQRLRRSRS